jgi:ABC-type sugar transport system substrate-binding protein
MSRRKPLAVLAAATAAAALAVPAAASAAPFTPEPIVYSPPPYLCAILDAQTRAALAVGNTLGAELLVQTQLDVGCGNPAI